jgi:hypothetical protein
MGPSNNSHLTSSRQSAIDASYPWQFGGLTMQTFAKVLVYVVFACLLLSGVNGPQRTLHRASGDLRFGRERHRALVRLRRCRQDNPSHLPVRPCKNAVLPPDDDDDDDGEKDHGNDGPMRLLSPSHDEANRAFFPTIRSQPLPTDIPRYQTLCILLI